MAQPGRPLRLAPAGMVRDHHIEFFRQRVVERQAVDRADIMMQDQDRRAASAAGKMQLDACDLFDRVRPSDSHMPVPSRSVLMIGPRIPTGRLRCPMPGPARPHSSRSLRPRSLRRSCRSMTMSISSFVSYPCPSQPSRSRAVEIGAAGSDRTTISRLGHRIGQRETCASHAFPRRPEGSACRSLNGTEAPNSL